MIQSMIIVNAIPAKSKSIPRTSQTHSIPIGRRSLKDTYIITPADAPKEIESPTLDGF